MNLLDYTPFILIPLLYIFGSLFGSLTIIRMHSKNVSQDKEKMTFKNPDLDNIKAMQKDFHNLIWKSYGVFIAALIILAGWTAKDLAFKTDFVVYIAPKSFISSLLLAFIISVALLMTWASYIQYSLWLLNKDLAEFDPLYYRFLYDPIRVGYNKVYAQASDLFFISLCWIIIISYQNLGIPSVKDIYWNTFYYLSIFIFGFGCRIRFSARSVVRKGLKNPEVRTGAHSKKEKSNNTPETK